MVVILEQETDIRVKSLLFDFIVLTLNRMMCVSLSLYFPLNIVIFVRLAIFTTTYFVNLLIWITANVANDIKDESWIFWRAAKFGNRQTCSKKSAHLNWIQLSVSRLIFFTHVCLNIECWTNLHKMKKCFWAYFLFYNYTTQCNKLFMG